MSETSRRNIKVEACAKVINATMNNHECLTGYSLTK